jgi:hypothetical protein
MAPAGNGNLKSDWAAASERNHMGEVKPVEMSGNPNQRKIVLDFATHSEMTQTFFSVAP